MSAQYQYQVAQYAADPRKRLLKQARSHAARSGHPCTITLLETCVIAGYHNRPSLDRVRNDLGYVPGNVRVISHRANVMKRDIDLEFAKRLVEYLR